MLAQEAAHLSARSTSSNLRYLDELLSLRCAPELLSCGLFPAQRGAKEATECMAMLAALRHHVLPVVSLSRVDAIVVVGDG